LLSLIIRAFIVSLVVAGAVLESILGNKLWEYALAGLVYTVLAILESVVPSLPFFSRLLADLTEIVFTAGAELESV
jgi:hypothetical protein